MTDLCFTSVPELSRLLATRQVSSRELFYAYLAKIDLATLSLNDAVPFDRDGAYI